MLAGCCDGSLFAALPFQRPKCAILPLHGGYPQPSPVWVLWEGEKAHPGPGTLSTTSAANHHARLGILLEECCSPSKQYKIVRKLAQGFCSPLTLKGHLRALPTEIISCTGPQLSGQHEPSHSTGTRKHRSFVFFVCSESLSKED